MENQNHTPEIAPETAGAPETVIATPDPLILSHEEAPKAEKKVVPRPPVTTKEGKELEVFIASEVPVEEKLEKGIAGMRAALSGATPRMRAYWDLNGLVIPLLSLRMNPEARKKAVEGLTEIRAMRDAIKAQISSVSVQVRESTERALKELSEDIKNMALFAERTPKFTLPPACLQLLKRDADYRGIQDELAVLTPFVNRIHALRKEITSELPPVVSGAMRGKLSKLGDKIFPRRSELLKKASEMIREDLVAFESGSFGADGIVLKPAGALMAEIRGLQSVVRNLCDSETFKFSRELLGRCWDRAAKVAKEVKPVARASKFEKPARREREEEGPGLLPEQALRILPEVEKLHELCKGKIAEVTLSEARSKLEGMMRTQGLSKKAVSEVTRKIDEACAPYYERIEKRRLDAQKERELGLARVQSLKVMLEALIENQSLELGAFREKERVVRDLFESEIDDLSPLDIHNCNLLLRKIALMGCAKEVETLKEWNPLVDCREALEKLQDEGERHESALRGLSGGSPADAMARRGLSHAAKALLAEIGALITKIDAKLETL